MKTELLKERGIEDAGETLVGLAPERALDDMPQPDIPTLRQKEKERKGVGVYWQTGCPGGGGALARVAASEPALTECFGLGRIAAKLAAVFGGRATLLGQLLLSKAGAWLVLAGVVAGGTAAGALVGFAVAPSARPVAAAFTRPSLSGPSSTIALAAPRDKSLDYVARANQGEILFEDRNFLAPKDEGTGAGAGRGAGSGSGAAEAPPVPGADATVDALGAFPAGGAAEAAQLSTKLNGLGNASGNNFASGARLADLKPLNGGFQLKQPSALPALDKNHQKLTGFRKTPARMSATNMSGTQGHANRAMGQLKMARTLSFAAAGMPSSEGQRQYATNAFEQQATQGGQLAAPVANDGVPQVVVPPGSGAPNTMDTTQPAEPAIPDVPTAVDATPDYTQQKDMAKALAALAAMLRMIGMIMLAIGAVLMAVGMSLMHPPTTMIGIALLAAGAALLAMGMMMLSAAKNAADQASKIGQQMQDEGQQTQGQIAKDDAQAKANGQSYTPPDMTKKLGDNAELHQRIDTERNATYNLPGVKDASNTANTNTTGANSSRVGP